MYKKQLPQTDAERIEALQIVMLKTVSQPKDLLPFSMDIACYVYPFLQKLKNCSQVNKGTQSVDNNLLREVIDQLVADIWDEIEAKYDNSNEELFISMTTEYGVKYELLNLNTAHSKRAAA